MQYVLSVETHKEHTVLFGLGCESFIVTSLRLKYSLASSVKPGWWELAIPEEISILRQEPHLVNSDCREMAPY